RFLVHYIYAHLNSYFFFFSSRRRHTRSKRDWSSDVCSSDLTLTWLITDCLKKYSTKGNIKMTGQGQAHIRFSDIRCGLTCGMGRSEERRVGKEWRGGGWREHRKKEERERRSEEGAGR